MPRKTLHDSSKQIPAFVIGIRFDNWTKVTCGRCDGAFSVDEPKWHASSELRTRPCPYCWKVGLIP